MRTFTVDMTGTVRNPFSFGWKAVFTGMKGLLDLTEKIKENQ